VMILHDSHHVCRGFLDDTSTGTRASRAIAYAGLGDRTGCRSGRRREEESGEYDREGEGESELHV